jgi:Phage integrase, N-terminal SAM-like domain
VAPPSTLSQWVPVWLPAHLAGPATTAKYRSMLRNHILPAFGDHRLDAITRNEVKAFARIVAGQRRRPPSAVSSLSSDSFLRDAIGEHYLFFDPTARLRLRDGPGPRRRAGRLAVAG